MSAIAVMGATGHTGSLVAHALVERGHQPILIGRDGDRLAKVAAKTSKACQVRVASPTDPASLASLFEGVSVVINTVGPFVDLGEPVVRAALNQGVHYLDTTGEQAFMQSMRTRYDGRAQNAEIAVVCAQAFEYALGTCAAAVAIEGLGGRCDSVETFYQTSGGGVSPGTAKSMFRMLSRPMLAWRQGRLIEERLAQHVTEVTFPEDDRYRLAASFGGGIALYADALGDVREARSFMVMPQDMIAWLKRFSRIGRLGKSKTIQRVADALIGRFVRRPDGAVNDDNRFRVTARARRGGSECAVHVRGGDPYVVTAAIAAEGALRLRDGSPRQVGVVAPPMAFDSTELLDALTPIGVSWGVVNHGH